MDIRNNIEDSITLKKHKPDINLLKLFFVNLAVMIVIYSTLLTVPHFSTDTYSVFVTDNGNIDIHISHGRFVSALFYQVLSWINFDYKSFAAFGSFLLIVICAWGVTMLTWRFNNAMKNNRMERLVSTNIVMLTLAVNMSIMEVLLFPDVSFSFCLGFLLCFASVIFWCKEQKTAIDYLLSFLFLCLALNVYQVFIGFFVIICMAYTLVSFGFSSCKFILIHACRILSTGFFASFITLICMKIPSYIGCGNIQYLGELSIRNIIENAKAIIGNQKGIWGGFLGFLPPYAPIFFFLVSVCLLGVSMCKRRAKPFIWLLCILVFLGSWFMVFAPYFIAQTVWLPPRTLFSLFAFMALPGLLTVSISTQKNIGTALIYAMLLLVMAVGIQKVSINNYAGNKIDQEICNIIIHKIDQYEQETGNVIDEIAVRSDGNTCYGYDGVSYTIMDTNLRAFAVPWSDVSSIEFFSGRSFQRKEMTAEKYKELFGEKSWDYFDSEEQLFFDGTTMYLAVY